MEPQMTQIAPMGRSIRASSMPLAALCAASQLEDSFRMATGGAAADVGSAAHAYLARRISGQPSDVVQIAGEFGVDAHELGKLCAWAWKAWERVAQWFPSPQTEVPLSLNDDAANVELTGHVDVLAIVEVPKQIRILDFKSGRLDIDAAEQLRAYGYLALQKYPEADSVYAAVLRVRDQIVDGYHWSREELDDWWVNTTRHLQAAAYSPGPHCQFCRRATVCPAITALLKQSRRVLMDELSEGDPELLAEAMPTDPVLLGRLGIAIKDGAALITSRLDNWKEAYKVALRKVGGAVPTGDGRELVLIDQEQHPLKATPESIAFVLSNVSPDTIPEVIGIGKGALEKAIKGATGRGQKTKAWSDTLERFESFGAVGTKVIERLETRRIAVPAHQEMIEVAHNA